MTELVPAREQPQPVPGICTQQALQAQCALPGTPLSALLFNLGQGREKTDFTLCCFAYKLNFERPECAQWAGRQREQMPRKEM